MWNLVVNAIAILVIPLAFWIIERKSKRSKLVKDPSDYWEKFHSDASITDGNIPTLDGVKSITTVTNRRSL